MPFDLRFKRDYEDVSSCDAMLVNFLGARRRSNGSTVELGWAYMRGIHVVTCIEEENPNHDVFVDKCMGIQVRSLKEGINKIRQCFALPAYDEGD